MSTARFGTTIAVLLAGGKGTRLRQSGRGKPKPLLDIAGEPVINFLVRRLLELDGDERIDKIYVLLRKKQLLPPTVFHPNRVELDLEREFSLWREIWFWAEKDRISLVYEEDLDEPAWLKKYFPDIAIEGAIAGLARWLYSDYAKTIQPGTRILLAAADNFLPDVELAPFLQLCDCGISVNAYKDLGDPQKIREKFGCLTTFKADDDTEWLSRYSEKPTDPGQEDTKASVALYCFPLEHVNLLKEYVDTLKPPRDPKVALGAPGFFLEWLATNTSVKKPLGQRKSQGVKAFPIAGKWFDIGDPADLRIATYWHTHSGRLETVEDLIVARETGQLDDNSFLLVRRMEIDSENRTVRIWHKADDPLCCLRPDGRGLRTVTEIKETAAADTGENIWNVIEAGLDTGRHMPRQDLKDPLLLSAGVFLFDCDGATPDGKLGAGRALLPLLEKDLSSNMDRDGLLPRQAALILLMFNRFASMKCARNSCSMERAPRALLCSSARSTHRIKPARHAKRYSPLLEKDDWLFPG